MSEPAAKRPLPPGTIEVTHKNLQTALRTILPNYEVLISADVLMPRLLDMAVRHIFLHQLREDCHTETVRQALRNLEYRAGYLTNPSEPLRTYTAWGKDGHASLLIAGTGPATVGNRPGTPLDPDCPDLIWAIEAANWWEASEKYHELQGWGPYKRPDDWQELDLDELPTESGLPKCKRCDGRGMTYEPYDGQGDWETCRPCGGSGNVLPR